jgi:glycosyltransferase involved in cell wall biosynthesis
MDREPESLSYVLVTAACNEEEHIERLISAVLSQVALPTRWVIVSDGSVDSTDEIVTRYATLHPFIALRGPER